MTVPSPTPIQYRAVLISTAKIDPENPPKTEQWFSASLMEACDWAMKVLARSPEGSVVKVWKQEELVEIVTKVPVTRV